MSEVRVLTLRIHPEPDHVWAEVEEMPGLFAAGRDVEELREALVEAISLYLADSEVERDAVSLTFDPPSKVTRVPVRAELVHC